MKEFTEKLISRLEEESYDMEICEEQFDMNRPYFKDVPYKMLKLEDAKTIISQFAEEYVPNTNVGKISEWIPVEERLPERKEKKKQFGNKQKRTNVLVTLRNGIVKEMMYEFETKEFWEPGDENPIEHWKEDVMDSDFEVIAWQPLPAPYKEKGE